MPFPVVLPERHFKRSGISTPNAKLEIIMPKLKTHKGAAKRFKKTGTGKVKRNKAFLRHILTSKDKKRKSKLGTSTLVSDADLAKVKRMIPY